MSAEKTVLTIDRPAEGIARIGLNRPEKRNALDPELRLALIDGIEAVLEDSSVRALILAGNGGHFCAGGDIASMEGLDAAAGRARMKSNHRMVRLVADAENPSWPRSRAMRSEPARVSRCLPIRSCSPNRRDRFSVFQGRSDSRLRDPAHPAAPG